MEGRLRRSLTSVRALTFKTGLDQPEDDDDVMIADGTGTSEWCAGSSLTVACVERRFKSTLGQGSEKQRNHQQEMIDSFD